MLGDPYFSTFDSMIYTRRRMMEGKECKIEDERWRMKGR